MLPIESEGTKKRPLLVTQTHYRRCRHVVMSPKEVPGKHHKIIAYLDVGDWCPTCKPEHSRRKKIP